MGYLFDQRVWDEVQRLLPVDSDEPVKPRREADRDLREVYAVVFTKSK